MRFHFCAVNHEAVGRRTLADVQSWVEAGLRELGHEVTSSETELDPGAINLLWEKFLPGFGRRFRAAGVRYGVICTEIPDGDGFNWRRDDEWVERWRGFGEAAEGADFIWATVESAVPDYARYAPAGYMEFGYAAALVPPPAPQEPTADFCFYGLPTPHRRDLVERLRRHASVEWPDRIGSVDEINALIGRARIGLCFKQSETWPAPSSTRLGRLLMARRGIAAERTRVITRQAALVPTAAEGEDFVDFALGRLHGSWRQDAQTAFERYRDELPMAGIMERLIDVTIGDRAAAPLPGGAPFALVLEEEPPRLVATVRDISIVAYLGRFFALPHAAGARDLRVSLDVPGALSDTTYDRLLARLHEAPSADEVRRLCALEAASPPVRP